LKKRRGMNMANIRIMATQLRKTRQLLMGYAHTLEAIAEQPRNGDWVVEKLEEAGIEIEGEEE
tara:strand:- start:2871 stop:3059 length:189 start_codon:yes stop_codon:yes gene_type:complete